MHIRTHAIRSVYSLLFLVAIPLVILRLLIRSRKQPAYRQRLKERFGFINSPKHPSSIWLHSVSVGETIAAMPLISKLITAYPHKTIYVTTTTPTGSEQLLKHFGQQISHSYLPYDVPLFINRFLKTVKPSLCIIMETEVWPNILYCCQQQRIPTLLANARLSQKSFQGYARFKIIAHDLFNLFTEIAAQSKLDAKHFEELGVSPNKISITGSIKFDSDIDTDIKTLAQAQRHDWQLSGRPVIIAASTRDGEELQLLDAFMQLKKSHPEAFLILVPRHIERSEQVIKLCNHRQLTVTQRSQQTAGAIDSDILLGDTIGELLFLYAVADIAFVGGSLVDTGCHNVLEPAALSLPIITGPSIRNFKSICTMLIDGRGQIIVQNADELCRQWQRLIEDKSLAKQIGENAAHVYQNNKGAMQKLLKVIFSLAEATA